MADQQDQSLSGGSVEKANTSADTSKLHGKGSSAGGGSSGYRKRHNNHPVQNNFEEKRRKFIIGESQALSAQSYKHSRPIELTKGESRARNVSRNERTNGAGLECLFGELPFINSTFFLMKHYLSNILVFFRYRLETAAKSAPD